MPTELPPDLKDKYTQQVHPALKAFVDAADGLMRDEGPNHPEALAPLNDLVGHVKSTNSPFIMWHPGG
jgi:hypothetical protein